MTIEIFRTELEDIMNWWSLNMIDHENGGFYGRMDHDHMLHKKHDKAIVLNSRILWSFSSACYLSENKDFLAVAKRSFSYLSNYFMDPEYGGVYWHVDYNGNPLSTKKQIYAQAFAIYAFVAFFKITRDPIVLDKAMQLFELIESYSWDPVDMGYFEAFDRNWEIMGDVRLSAKDANEVKTMNTHLHILEAYTQLYSEKQDERIAVALSRLIEIFLEKIISKQGDSLQLFFDEKWKVKSQIISYGHDIECSWLLCEAVEALDDEELNKRVRKASLKLTEAVYCHGRDTDGSIYNELEDSGKLNREKHWWPQAEAVIGFWNAWQLTGDAKFKNAAKDCWTFIVERIKDKQKGEWIWGLNEFGEIMEKEDKAGPWKAPYHNSRMCLEMMNRLNNL